MKLKVETMPCVDGRVRQRLWVAGDVISEWVLDTRLADVRAALKELGWTEPGRTPPDVVAERDAAVVDASVTFAALSVFCRNYIHGKCTHQCAGFRDLPHCGARTCPEKQGCRDSREARGRPNG